MTRSIGKMRIILSLLGVAALAVLSFAPSALADGTASMTLTSAGSNPFANIYMGPYTATVNGVSTPVICDDFTDDSYLGESWTANVSGYPNPTGMFSAKPLAGQGYDEVAALTLALVNPANSSQVDQIQYALWAVFNKSSVQTYLQDNLSNSSYNTFYTNGVLDWLSWAGTQTLSADQLAGLEILTPNTQYPITCSGHSCANTPPQEFIAITPTPESGTASLFGIGLLALAFFMRRRIGMATN